jgi:hypothetical protein
MSNLKPIGSEKLTGQNKLNRIMEIARFNEVIPQSINETAKSEYSVSLADGHNYQIVREKQGYIIKKTISESGTDYLEPMKNRKYYSSYSQAFKRLNLVAGELNRLNENEEGVSLYGEQKKFVLKTPKPEMPEAPVAPPMAPPMAPPAVPSPELPPAPDMGDEGMDMGDEGMDMGDEGMEMGDEGMDMGGNDSEEQVSFKTIQKLTGKLTQKIRVLDNEEGMTSEDIKYVINMVLSSLELGSLSEEDKEDIMSKFEEQEEDFGNDMGGDDMDGEDLTDDSEVENIQSDMDIPIEGEMDEDMYGSFGNMKRKDFKGDKYYDENDRAAKDFDIMGIGGDDFDTEEFDTFQKLYDKYGDKQPFFNKRDGEKMFNTYREKTGKPFKVKTRKGEMEEGDMYGSFGNMKRDDYKGDNYYDENDRPVRDSDLYGIAGDDFDTEEFDTFQKLYDKYGDKQPFFRKSGGGERMFDMYKEKTGRPFKIKTRKSEMEEEGYGDDAIIDSIFGESQVDKVISKYFEISKKEILESKEKHSQEKRSVISKSKKQMEEVIKLSETVEQELSAKKFLENNSNAKIVGVTNKKNLVFENKGKQVKISPEGLLV